MDIGPLLVSFVFGLVGMAYFVYGRKVGRIIPLAAGMGLMAIPMFIPSVLISTGVCAILAATPFFIRES